MIKVGETEHEQKPIFIPHRFRLRDAFMGAEGSADTLMAVCGAVLAQSCPSVLGTPMAEQREAIKTRLLDYGEEAVHVLLSSGMSMDRLMQEGSSLLLSSLRELPTDQEMEQAQDFSEARTEADCTISSSVQASST